MSIRSFCRGDVLLPVAGLRQTSRGKLRGTIHCEIHGKNDVMSTQRKAEFADEPVSESAVHDFLVDNPDFFERHASLLGSLRLPHGAVGAVFAGRVARFLSCGKRT